METIVKDMPFEITHFIKTFHENSNTILLLACKSYISDQDFIIWIKRMRIDPYITNNFFFQVIVDGIYYCIKIEINYWKDTYPNFRWRHLSPSLTDKNIFLLKEIVNLSCPVIYTIQGLLSSKIDNLIRSGV